MRTTVKVLATAVVTLLAAGPKTASSAEACPTECRQQIETILCSTETYDDGVFLRYVRRYWSDGAE